jgi:uncharacterized protein YkwD
VPKLPRAILAAILALSALLAAHPAPAAAATLDQGESALLTAVNGFRAARGLPTLVASDTLTYAAKWMATDMAVNNYFSHTSRDGRSPTQRMADFGYPAFATWAGEDLAAGYVTAAEVLNGWLNSPAHLAVLTNPAYHAIGIGRAYGAASAYGWYWAADFGGQVDAPTTIQRSDPGFHAAFAGQSPNPTLAPGETTTLVLALRNTGYRGWYLGSPGQQANIATADPLDVARPDLAVSWLSLNRPATTTTGYVGPDQVGWFQFQVKAPTSPGVYRLAVRGVIDGTTWLEDPGVFFLITVR